MQNNESLLNNITWAAEQVLRSADAFSSACERNITLNKTIHMNNTHPPTHAPPQGELK